MGDYLNRTELGEEFLRHPSAILYRPGAWHENDIGEHGFEQIEIEFDPRWLGQLQMPDLPVTRWTGGRLGGLSRQFARRCSDGLPEQDLRLAIRSFLAEQAGRLEKSAPPWLADVEQMLRSQDSVRAHELAAQVRRHPFWLGQCYSAACGESLQQAKSRLRVERASRLLRETTDEAACIALEAGFCDQSHMIRTFRRVLGRTPSEVRSDRLRSSPATGCSSSLL